MVRVLTVALLVGCTNGKDGNTGETGETTPEPVEVTDAWTQTLTSPIDILWVLDGGWTTAMDAVDQTLENEVFELLLLADPSWKMGVIDSTAQGSKFGVITPQWSVWPGPDPFQAPAQAGPSRVREAIHMALELRADSSGNQDFIRSDAHLYVIAFTNSVDESAEPAGTTTGIQSSAISQSDFDTWFDGFQPSESTRLSVITDGAAKSYWKSHTRGGGILFEVGSFKTALQTMVLDAIGQRVTFQLTQIPVEEPQLASVLYRDHRTEYEVDKDFDYDPVKNEITFRKVIPPRDSTIEVTYLPATISETTPTTTE